MMYGAEAVRSKGLGLVGSSIRSRMRGECLRATDVADSDCGSHGRRVWEPPSMGKAEGSRCLAELATWGKSAIAMGRVDNSQGKMREALGGGLACLSDGGAIDSDMASRSRMAAGILKKE